MTELRSQVGSGGRTSEKVALALDMDSDSDAEFVEGEGSAQLPSPSKLKPRKRRCVRRCAACLGVFVGTFPVLSFPLINALLSGVSWLKNHEHIARRDHATETSRKSCLRYLLIGTFACHH